jgi:CRISPR-associated protein Cas5t
MIRLFVQAPFAAFRTFTAGWYRPTAAFITPSAAYGLALNLAGIETRLDDGSSPMTVTRFNLPPARIAIGADPANPWGPHPSVHTLYQQLHNYPVGASGKARKDDAKGNKYNITPIRREFLADVRAFVCLDFLEQAEIENSIRRALAGAPSSSGKRYGLPFMGDNAFLIDRIEVRDEPVAALWYRRLGSDAEAGMVPRATRLTIWIDRLNASRTTSALFAPDEEPDHDSSDPEWTAWTRVDPPVEPTAPAKTRKRKGLANGS